MKITLNNNLIIFVVLWLLKIAKIFKSGEIKHHNNEILKLKYIFQEY